MCSWTSVSKCSELNKTLSTEMTMKQDNSVNLAKDKNAFKDYIDV